MQLGFLILIFNCFRIYSVSAQCRAALNSYSSCLATALNKTRPDRAAIEADVKQCFQRNGCTVPDLNGNNLPQTSEQAVAEERRLGQSPFSSVDWPTFQQCKNQVSYEARDLVRTCVTNKIDDFLPDVDEDLDGDGEQDAMIVKNRTLGSYAITKLIADPSICPQNVDQAAVKACVLKAFSDRTPSDDTLKRMYDRYCQERSECAKSLSDECNSQLQETRAQLCRCATDDAIVKTGELSDEFIRCTKVADDQRSRLSYSAANPQKIFVSNAYCSVKMDPCSAYNRQRVDLAGDSQVAAIVRQLLDPVEYQPTIDLLGAVGNRQSAGSMQSISFVGTNASNFLGNFVDPSDVDGLIFWIDGLNGDGLLGMNGSIAQNYSDVAAMVSYMLSGNISAELVDFIAGFRSLTFQLPGENSVTSIVNRLIGSNNTYAGSFVFDIIDPVNYEWRGNVTGSSVDGVLKSLFNQTDTVGVIAMLNEIIGTQSSSSTKLSSSTLQWSSTLSSSSATSTPR